jgi:16S rRNA U516 pseudouridylate synthase RsuA-like enzyme
MLFNLRHSVLKIKRVRYAFLDLQGVPSGKYRFLDSLEVKRLKTFIRPSSALSSKTPKAANQ